MQAVEGAIWRVEIRKEEVRSDVIGEGPPKGICGTGIVDAVAQLLKLHLLDRSGLMKKGSHPFLTERGLLLDEAAGVILEPQDIATIQKAKAAIAATLKVLQDRLDLESEDLQRVFLAGAFGSRLNAGSAGLIGLLPSLEPGSYVSAGNTALLGASLVLLSAEAREKTERLAQTIEHVNVAKEERFEDLFLDNLYFS
jgi:uncharacterized 2Fe-2S/4Fe-4S cluster protein (DUF4445 family)